jgi:lipopolysaccharide transport system ATP-binding protein
VERLRRLSEGSGAAVLFVGHDLASVRRLCRRVLWLDCGRLRADGAAPEVTRAYGALAGREEEARLRAGELRVAPAHALPLVALPGRRHLLLRLVCPGEAVPRRRHRVYRVRLEVGGREAGALDVGAPRDNDAGGEPHFVMEQRGLLNWGPPGRDVYGFYREFADHRGRYRHAPFAFLLPPGPDLARAAYTVEVTASVAGDEVLLEAHTAGGYLPLGRLVPGGPAQAYPVAFDGAVLGPGAGRRDHNGRPAA